MCTVLKKDVVMSKLVPMLVDLLKDEHHEVKLGVLTGLQSVAKVVGPDLLTSGLLMSLSNLMKEPKWRVRYSVVTLVSELAREFGKEFYAKNVEPIFLLFLTDITAAVREAGIEWLQVLAKEFKADWIVNAYIPKAVEILGRDKQGYLYRMTILNSIEVCALKHTQIEHDRNAHEGTDWGERGAGAAEAV